VKRRELISLLGGAAVAWPLAARAQQPAMPVIGFLHIASSDGSADRLRAFRQGLKEAGFAERENVAIEYSWAENQTDRLPELAAELVRRKVAVIATTGGPAVALAAKTATTTIPIVFTTAGDPVAQGLVANLNRPDANVTGVSFLVATLAAKQLGLLHELLPGAARIAVLVDPNNTLLTEAFIPDVRAAASAIRKQIDVLYASTGRDIDTVFESLAQKPVDALLVGPGAFFFNRRVQLVTLATRHAVPTIYGVREFVEAGGLMSYGTSLTDAYRQAGIYAGRILKGEKPGDLPVMLPTKFEFVINIKTAKALCLEIPDRLLALADEVIE
jgi:putative tryptophan/tyrosine transport system substrate-binding protein